MNDILFTINIIYTIFYEYICYLLGKHRFNAIKDLTNYLSSSNILFSKFFQSISVSSNLLTKQEMNYLSNYTDNVSYKNDEIINLGNIPNNLKIFTQNPVKSGLISLVYYGELLINNQPPKPVVIKVLRKNIQNKLFKSAMQFHTFLNILSYLPYISSLQLVDAFNENIESILEQTDFIKETENCKEFYESFRHMQDIIIPKVYSEYTITNPNIIVLDKINTGLSLRELSNNDKYKYADLIAKFTLKSILYDGVYHADMHAGNIFFIKSDGICKLGVIDYGIIGHITENEQNIYYNFFKSGFINKNYYNASNILLENLTYPLDTIRKMETHKKINLLIEITCIAKKVFESVDNFDINFVYKVNTILSKYNLKLSENFTKIQIALGICYSLCNELCYKTEKKYVSSINNIIRKLII